MNIREKLAQASRHFDDEIARRKMTKMTLPDLGTRIHRLPEMELFQYLEWFEGPILSELRTSEGHLYVEKWCTEDGDVTRSLIVRTEQRALAEYLGMRKTMWDLLRSASDGMGFLVDRRGAKTVDQFHVELSTLPEDYFPDRDVMHDIGLRPSCGQSCGGKVCVHCEDLRPNCNQNCGNKICGYCEL